jgi:leucine dehydrogenase
MDREDQLEIEFAHEKLIMFQDPKTGAKGVIAIHSTALGPAMGGLRLFGYPTLTDGMVDALRLARAMSFKNAAAGLDLGGGKAVLFDDGRWDERRSERMRAVGRAIEDLEGSYVTAEDVGTTPADMDEIAEVTSHVAGCSVDRGGRGDPSEWTARTVFGAIASGVRIRLGNDDLRDVRVGIQGVGHVGSRLIARLVAAGAEVFVSDVDPRRVAAITAKYPVTALPLDGFEFRDFEVLAPCAMGGGIGADSAASLRCPVIAGAANNPLACPATATALAAYDILYVPDFLANCGGIINVGAEVLRLSEPEVEGLIQASLARTEQILIEARESGAPPLELAMQFAEGRIGRGRSAPPV